MSLDNTGLRSTFAVAVWGLNMAITKIDTVTVRIDPGAKEALRVAATRQHRSIAE